MGGGVAEGDMKRAIAAAGLIVLSALRGAASGVYEADAQVPDSVGVMVVEVRAGTQDVSVTPGDVADISQEAADEASWFGETAGQVRLEREGNRLYAWIEADGPFAAPLQGRICLRVPKGASITVRTSSGNVHVEGVNGKVDVSTASGSVDLHRVHGRVVVDSVSGDVVLDALDGPLNARTDSGRIEGHFLVLSDYCELGSVSGSIDLSLASGLEMIGFDLRSVSGTIRLGTIRTERGLRMGFGRALLRARTVSGSVSIQ